MIAGPWCFVVVQDKFKMKVYRVAGVYRPVLHPINTERTKLWRM